MISKSAVVALAMLFGLASQTARAETDARAQAKADLVAGMTLLGQGDNQGALAKFDAAFALVPSPKVQFNRGLALEGLGRNVEALVAFDAFLAGATDLAKDKREPGEKHRRDLLAKVAAITITSEVAGVAVSIDSVPRGKTPFARPIYVEPGSHQLVAEAAGTAPASQTFAASKGAELSIPVASTAVPKVALTAPLARTAEPAPITPAASPTLALAPPPPGPAAPLVSSGDHQSFGPQADVTATSSAESAPGSGNWRRPVKWVSFGLAAVSLGVGVLETVTAVQKSQDFNKVMNQMCMDDGSGHIRGGSACEQVAHDQTVATWGAAVGYGLGAAFAATGVVLHLTEPRDSKSTALLDCGVGPALTGAACVAHW